MRSAFFEAVFVVLGVVLALAANEWRQNVQARNLADAAMQSILSEIETNLNLVRESQEYHQNQVQMLQGKMAAGETLTMKDFPQGFINPAWVTDTAWEVAKETGVLADMDYQAVLTLSTTYDRLEHYAKQGELVGYHIYGTILSQGSQSIIAKPANLMTILYTFIYRGIQLEENLTATLAELRI